ncbi:MAG TPA: hypothetical protein VL358_15725 [Caulobacteraceae bacterium]|jgi:hypothetical protein|nr:hypothetical protein [Caulobacteraceae bacterium]
MPPRDTLTGPPPPPGLLDWLGVAAGLAALFGVYWGLAAIFDRLRKPPPPNVVRMSSRPIALGVMALVFAALIVFSIGYSFHVPAKVDDLAIGIFDLAVVVPGGVVAILAGLCWSITVEEDGIVHSGPFGSGRIAWTDIRSMYVGDGGYIICELASSGRIQVRRDAVNRDILIPAGRAAGVPEGPHLEREPDEEG